MDALHLQFLDVSVKVGKNKCGGEVTDEAEERDGVESKVCDSVTHKEEDTREKEEEEQRVWRERERQTRQLMRADRERSV